MDVKQVRFIAVAMMLLGSWIGFTTNARCSLGDGSGSALMAGIQSVLDQDQGLKQEKIVLSVVEEKGGLVTIEMCAGDKEVRHKIRINHYDIFKQQFETSWKVSETLFPEMCASEKRAVAAIRNVLAKIQKMPGVKQVRLTAAVNTLDDRVVEAYKLYFQKKYPEALKIGLDAAAKGNAWAQYLLGLMYSTGQGTAKDDAKAAEWLGKAAAQGNSQAQFLLGCFYADGTGVTKDCAKAYALCLKSAEQGYTPAFNVLGMMYQRGDVVPRDLAQSIKWYRKAAEKDDADSLNGLAWLYATCEDPRYQNGAEAVKYALRAVTKAKDEYKKCIYTDTLAAAYARDGQFEQAVITEEQALELLNGAQSLAKEKQQDLAKGRQERLELYRKHEAYIERTKVNGASGAAADMNEQTTDSLPRKSGNATKN